MSLFSVTMAVCWWPEIRVVLFPGCLWPCDRVCAEAYQHLYDTCLCPRSSSISGHLLDVFHHQVRWQHSGGWDKAHVKVSSSNPQIIFRFKCSQFIMIFKFFCWRKWSSYFPLSSPPVSSCQPLSSDWALHASHALSQECYFRPFTVLRKVTKIKFIEWVKLTFG